MVETNRALASARESGDGAAEDVTIRVLESLVGLRAHVAQQAAPTAALPFAGAGELVASSSCEVEPAR
eukprot:6673361-Heterocapsa_arctica.AAC.1